VPVAGGMDGFAVSFGVTAALLWVTNVVVDEGCGGILFANDQQPLLAVSPPSAQGSFAWGSEGRRPAGLLCVCRGGVADPAGPVTVVVLLSQ
jgi:hypothetical protein